MKTVTYDESKYRIVPIEPTAAMVKAGYDIFDDAQQIRAAILAAPQPPAVDAEPVMWMHPNMASAVPSCIKEQAGIFGEQYSIPLFDHTQPTSADDVIQDAELGRIAMKFVDRAGDVHPGIDDAETICREFHRAMSDTIDRIWHERSAIRRVREKE